MTSAEPTIFFEDIEVGSEQTSGWFEVVPTPMPGISIGVSTDPLPLRASWPRIRVG